jgi:putative hydrolase of the HAD superfamily
MSGAIRAVTFDLWDTVVVDDSDEAIRAERGLPTKVDARIDALHASLEQQAPCDRAAVVEADAQVGETFRRAWHDEHVTWTVLERLSRILTALDRTLPDSDVLRVIRAWEEMEMRCPPVLVPGAAEALTECADRWSLAIVSDAVVSPGRCLRRILHDHGVAGAFQTFAFSDEVGRSKPHRAMFDAVAAALDVPLDHMAHVGDREHTDVRGAQGIGMKAVLFVGSRAADRSDTHADAVCEDLRELPAIIQQW